LPNKNIFNCLLNVCSKDAAVIEAVRLFNLPSLGISGHQSHKGELAAQLMMAAIT